MLDAESSALLRTINEACKEGYKVMEAGELGLMPCDGLPQPLRTLKEHGLIDVRYAEDGVYCIAPLPAGREYFETLREEQKTHARDRRAIWLCAFSGALAGSALTVLLAVVLLLLLKAVTG